MKQFLRAVVTAFTLVAFPATGVYASECKLSQDTLHEAFADTQVRIVTLSAEQIATLIAEKGTPPGYREGIEVTGEVYVNGDTSALVLFQEACAIANLGPIPTFRMLQILGITEANH